MLADLKDFEKFLKICRKQGVDDVNFHGISVKFGPLPTKREIHADEGESEVTENMTPEQLMYYAVSENI